MTEVEVSIPAEEVIEHFVQYFRTFTDVTPRKEGAIREHVLSRSRDGAHTQRGRRCLHLLCWSKGREGDWARRDKSSTLLGVDLLRQVMGRHHFPVPPRRLITRTNEMNTAAAVATTEPTTHAENGPFADRSTG